MKNLLLTLGIAVAIISSLIVGDDALTFHQVMAGKYRTPWFDQNWIASPYTHARLLGQPTSEYWTTNATKTERWRVKEVEYRGKTFWTTLDRRPMEG